jgi:hypothetical protein
MRILLELFPARNRARHTTKDERPADDQREPQESEQESSCTENDQDDVVDAQKRPTPLSTASPQVQWWKDSPQTSQSLSWRQDPRNELPKRPPF